MVLLFFCIIEPDSFLQISEAGGRCSMFSAVNDLADTAVYAPPNGGDYRLEGLNSIDNLE